MSREQLGWKDKAAMIGKAAAIGIHVAGEYAFPRKAWQQGDVPRSYREITPEWLTAILCKDIPGAKILAVEATGGSVGTSSRHGLLLTLNREAAQAGLPDRLFTKATTQFTQRLVLGLSKVILGEIAFYNHLRKPLNIEAPLGYFGCVDTSSMRSMVLMEDIAHSKGAQFISTETYITRPQIEALLSDMAKYHGYYWNSQELKRNFSFLATPAQRWDLLAKIGFQERSLVGARRAASVIPAPLINRQQDLWRAVSTSFALNAQWPETLLHGDSHIGQTYITCAGTMGLADWQAIMRGGWAFDVAYLIASALTVADRRQWEQDLIRMYLDRLRAAGGPSIAFDAAWLSYRQHTVYPYFAWVFTIGAGALQPNMQPDHISMAIIERTSHAIHDLDSLKLIAN